MFETRVPDAQACNHWTREQTGRVADVSGVGRVESWVEVSAIALPYVSFTNSFAFADGTLLTSDSKLRFRERDELEADLTAASLDLVDVRDVLAPAFSRPIVVVWMVFAASANRGRLMGAAGCPRRVGRCLRWSVGNAGGCVRWVAG